MLDIIITTYKRPAKVRELVDQLLNLPVKPVEIIVVDSSDEINQSLVVIAGVKYLKSSHKNQPYQRYLGYMASKSEFLVFLDDDMEVVDNQFLKKLEKLFENKTIAGIAIRFENKHEDSLLAQMPKSNLFKRSVFFKRAKDWLTGYPELKPGKFGLCGNRGKQPVGGGETEWLSGGAFAARRSAMFQNFNFQLFDIFEQKLGKGEDAIIGYGLSKQGKLIYHTELFFLHNDQRDSTYTLDTFNFAKRVAFSRLFLSLEKARLANESLLKARLVFHYYIFWRILGYLINYTFSPSKKRLFILSGSLQGWRQTLIFKAKSLKETRNRWYLEAQKDNSIFNLSEK